MSTIIISRLLVLAVAGLLMLAIFPASRCSRCDDDDGHRRELADGCQPSE
jgi:hypothetical protein